MSTEVQRAANVVESKGYLVERIYDGPDFSFVTFSDKATLTPDWPGIRPLGYVCFLAPEIRRARQEQTQSHLVHMRVRQAELKLLHDLGRTKIKENAALKVLAVKAVLSLLLIYPIAGRLF